MINIERIILAFGGAAVVGILMIVFAPDISNDRASLVVEHLGIAFVVASVVGITLELYLTRQMKIQMDRMLQDIGTDVFKAALGHQFPQSVWEQVSTHLLLNPVIREDCSLDYSLENLRDGDEDFIKVRQCWSYTLRNLNSSRRWVYPFVYTLERSLGKRFSGQTVFKRLEVGGKVVPNEELQLEEVGAEVTWRTIINLQPGESVKVVALGESVYRVDQVITFSMADAVENLTITISKPPNIEVTIDPIHRREERLTELRTASPESHRSWTVRGGLLPGHGVCIRWSPY